MTRGVWYGALVASLLSACDDAVLRAFESSTSALGGMGGLGSSGDAGRGRGGARSSDAGAGAGAVAGASAVAGAGAAGAAASLVIDDFEDGDTRAKEPFGWWYPVNDATGTQGFGIEPVSRGAASVYALRTHGSGFQDWGAAVGVNLAGDSASFSALGYQELCFAARVEAGSSTLIRADFVRGAQHYGQELSLSESWTRYCLPITDFIGPDKTVLVPDELIALQFFFEPGSPFLFWLDDVEVAQ